MVDLRVQLHRKRRERVLHEESPSDEYDQDDDLDDEDEPLPAVQSRRLVIQAPRDLVKVEKTKKPSKMKVGERKVIAQKR